MAGFLQKSLPFLLIMLASGSAHAEACTYREAIMALQQGNTIRGMALMRMADRDGDGRASRYLVVSDQQRKKATVIGYPLQQPLLSLNRINP